MAYTITVERDDTLALDDYLDHVEHEVDLDDLDSVAESAPLLKALSNDKRLVIRAFNRNLKAYLTEGLPYYGSQSFVLGTRNGQRSFYVRGNIWDTVTASAFKAEIEHGVYSYHVAHDHSFTFMTVGHFGPGYVTEIHEYDQNRVVGYVGEHVELRYLETTTLPEGKIMLYRPGRDVHVQRPPESLSISVNLMIVPDDVSLRDQYLFDLERSTIAALSHFAPVYRRPFLIEMAGRLGDGDTLELLFDIGREHPCRRVRLAAYQALMRNDASLAERLLTSLSEARYAELSPLLEGARRHHGA